MYSKHRKEAYLIYKGDKNMLRKEHPNPQCLREEWENLNGTWEFDFDFGRSAIERKFYETELSKKNRSSVLPGVKAFRHRI